MRALEDIGKSARQGKREARGFGLRTGAELVGSSVEQRGAFGRFAGESQVHFGPVEIREQELAWTGGCRWGQIKGSEEEGIQSRFDAVNVLFLRGAVRLVVAAMYLGAELDGLGRL